MIHFRKVTDQIAAWYRSGLLAEFVFLLACASAIGSTFVIAAMVSP